MSTLFFCVLLSSLTTPHDRQTKRLPKNKTALQFSWRDSLHTAVNWPFPKPNPTTLESWTTLVKVMMTAYNLRSGSFTNSVADLLAETRHNTAIYVSSLTLSRDGRQKEFVESELVLGEPWQVLLLPVLARKFILTKRHFLTVDLERFSLFSIRILFWSCILNSMLMAL